MLPSTAETCSPMPATAEHIALKSRNVEIEERLHRALKAAWPYVNRPFTSQSAKNEVGRFVEAEDITGQRVPMLFALQTAWTFVHGSDNPSLLEEMRVLLRQA